MQRRRAVAVARVTAHQRAPRLLVERIETEQLAATLDGVAERAVLFERRHQTREHLARALPEPFAVGFDPFVRAIGQQIALMYSVAASWRAARSPSSPRSAAASNATTSTIVDGCSRQASVRDPLVDERLELRPPFAQVMQFAPEIGQRLSVGRLRPERAADALARNRTSARVQHEKRDELLLTRARQTCDRPAVNPNVEPAEQIDAERGRTSHAQDYTRKAPAVTMVMARPIGTRPAHTRSEDRCEDNCQTG